MKLLDKVLRRTEVFDVPLVPLRDTVVFPGMVVPFFSAKHQTVLAVEEAMASDKRIFLCCQTNDAAEPKEEDLAVCGSLAVILQMMKLPDGTVRVLAEGQERACIVTYTRRGPSFRAEIRLIRETSDQGPAVQSLMRTVLDYFKAYAAYNKKIPPEVLASADKADLPDKLADTVLAQVNFKAPKKLELLAIASSETRLRELAVALQAENEILELQQKINSRVKKRIEKHQREYFLSEQVKEINKELGKDGEDPTGVKELEEKIKAKGLPEEVAAKAGKELRRLDRMQALSPEAAILRTYLEWLVDLPWNEKSEDNRDLERARLILEQDHYNMKKPKERVLDFIAVHQLKEKVKGPILCFVGPPGTGKTSLGKSVARALDRKFIRISLGGVRDEAEIRGHRKTYVGALPGKIIQSMRKAASRNPVFLLDEIDKMSSDFRGDPASALLEVLDPEQNLAFMDHYLEVPYDLSSVMFITTANSLHNIPWALRDRMEVIEIPGYTDYEKLMIAEGFIIPKQIEENGLGWAEIHFSRDGIKEIIGGYTMESGVRNLEREIAQVFRKIARKAVARGAAPALVAAPLPAAAAAPTGPAAMASVQTPESPSVPVQPPAQAQPLRVNVTAKSIRGYLGNHKYKRDLLFKDTRAGLSYGLAWTEMGGTVLPVEVVVFDGKGELLLTGSLGDVMKESALTALSYIKSYANRFRLDPSFYKGKDIHIHVPEGAIPKDGPSAGITLTCALLSALSGVPVKQGYAMTGEVTLTGKVLPIGGVKEKVLAAHRCHIPNVLMPGENRQDIDELPKEVVSSLRFIFVDHVIDAIRELFPEELFLVRPR